jgi:hypothetical protein
MMVELKSTPEVKRVILAAFPDYKKRRAFLSEFYSGKNINSYWDGGSKSEYAIVELATMTRKPLPSHTHPYFDVAARGMANQETAAVKSDHVGNLELQILPEGFALVEAGYFCGKPATAHVYLNSANLTKMLPASVPPTTNGKVFTPDTWTVRPTTFGEINPISGELGTIKAS